MPPDPSSEPETIEPEVLPPESDGRRLPPGDEPSRLHYVLIGLLLDLMDALTLGPIGFKLGLPLGFLAAYALFSTLKFSTRKKLLWSLVAGIYCTVPLTAPLPLGTLLTALMKLPRKPKS